MTRDTLNVPTARTWRDIPQPVVPRAMSREGRWRFGMSALRAVTLVAVVGAIGWGVCLVAASLRENTRVVPASAKAIPIKPPELRTDGVLTGAWLARTLALPKGTSLMEIDLLKLRARLLAEDQVLGATLTKIFPDRLVVQISERSPVARLRMRWMGQSQDLLVARDGVVYVGEGYDASVVNSLPWLAGVALTPDGGHFRPIAGMEVTAELLGKARLEAEHLYSTWRTVSLAQLDTDHRLEVTAATQNGERTIYFNTRDDFFRQLAKLNSILDVVDARQPGARLVIDLTLGQDVPVTTLPLETSEGAVPAPMPSRGAALGGSGLASAMTNSAASRFELARPDDARSAQALFVLPSSQTRKTKREL